METNKRFALQMFRMAVCFLTAFATIYISNKMAVPQAFLLALCGAPCLIFALFWLAFPPDSSQKASFIRKTNWVAFGIWTAGVVALIICLRNPFVFMSSVTIPLLLLIISSYNKALYAMQFPQSETVQAIKCPFYWVKRQFNFFKTIAVGLPILLPLTIGVMGAVAVGIHDGAGWIFPIASLVVGLTFSLLFFPVFFIQPTPHPSLWQKFCRQWAISLLVLGFRNDSRNDSLDSPVMLMPNTPVRCKNKSMHQQEIDYYKYWLSHPGIEITPQLYQLIDQLDTGIFDWQDPRKWPI